LHGPWGSPESLLQQSFEIQTFSRCSLETSSDYTMVPGTLSVRITWSPSRLLNLSGSLKALPLPLRGCGTTQPGWLPRASIRLQPPTYGPAYPLCTFIGCNGWCIRGPTWKLNPISGRRPRSITRRTHSTGRVPRRFPRLERFTPGAPSSTPTTQSSKRSPPTAIKPTKFL